jgi:succinate-semialdehyde dehydrogenase/glutarate-semialdehyde dehydrogenase
MAIESINPATGERVATFEPASREAVDAILTAAQTAQRAWSRTPLHARAQCLRASADLLRRQAGELAAIMATEMGKPLKDGAAEAAKCALVCDHYAENGERYLARRDEPSDASKSYVRFDPLGVVFAIMPWNFPLWQVFRFLAPALMAGNGAVLKHAPNVPQCALAIESIVRAAGFPEPLFRTLLVEASEAAGIIADPRIAAVTLTGSERAGRAVGEAAGKALKPMVLELGGSDPFIVLADCDLESTAKIAAAARTINAGQSCIAAKRFIVEASVYDAFIVRMAEALGALRMGDPFDPATDIGPQARFDLRDTLDRQVRTAIEQGARAVVGCAPAPGPGAFYPPSLLADVTPDNIAAREEIFGPVAAVMKVSGPAEAVELANASRFGLGASLWTSDLARAERIAAELEAGAVFVNGIVKSDPRLPFGGIKRSGLGRELGLEGARAFVNVKTVWLR